MHFYKVRLKRKLQEKLKQHRRSFELMFSTVNQLSKQDDLKVSLHDFFYTAPSHSRVVYVFMHTIDYANQVVSSSLNISSRERSGRTGDLI